MKHMFSGQNLLISGSGKQKKIHTSKKKSRIPAGLKVVFHKSLDTVPDNGITWLGHASFLIRLHGVKILIDPVLGYPYRLSPKGILLCLFLWRLSQDLDYILISHDHRDHCDEKSIKLLARQNPKAIWLCGLGLDSLLKKWTNAENIQAAGWYQQYHTPTPGLQIYYLPSRHWSRRGLTDTNTTLWGAFSGRIFHGKKIYFGGDSGYGSHVSKVRELFGEVDYYLAGIGAFAPRWFMGPSHMHPEEAARSL
jgi:L-ascorbate metabolism protein UlaG (beta-lactamase superfamily)